MDKYSVLMSVYYKEAPSNLNESLWSIFNQTVKPSDVVLVCDGPLTEDLDIVIKKFEEMYDILNVIRLKTNSGLGNALNYGLKYCKYNLVARMDSDDISMPRRCELQLKAFEKIPDLSICSGTVAEFVDSVDNIYSYRRLPSEHEDICSFSRKRCPFNHPAVMYKRDDVINVGSYKDLYLLEDYYLWVRMLNRNLISHNLSDVLVLMRSGSDLYKRRSGTKFVSSQLRLIKYMVTIGWITKKQAFQSGFIRILGSLMPNIFREIIYKKILRSSS